MKGIVAGKSSPAIRRSSLTTQMAGATCAEVRFAEERLCCLACFDVADAVGNYRFTMAAEERTPSATPAAVPSVRGRR